MHYRNGRAAKNGDTIITLNPYGRPIVGILYGAIAGNDSCNGNIALTTPSDICANLSECLHVDDLKSYISDSRIIPDTSATDK
jgi:hypothetical protein